MSPKWSTNVYERLVQPFTPKELSPQRFAGSFGHLECLVQTRHSPHVDRTRNDGVTLPLDPKLSEVGADKGECGDLRCTGERRRQIVSERGFVARVEFTVADHLGQKFGLIASRLEMHASPLDYSTDDAVAAITDEGGRVLSPALEREDEGGRRDRDRDAGRRRQS